MTDLIPLPKLMFETAPIPAAMHGPRGELAWIPISKLVIDPRYQRSVRADGRRNIKRIVERFNWAFFSPLIVCRRGADAYAVIDGQHRGIGAMTHGGVPEVPCLIIEGDEKAEARAFAIINGQVTSVMQTQVYYARLAGDEPKALELDRVCKAADVRIQKTPTGGYKVGETLAVGALETCLDKYGQEALITALQCITQTGNGNAGLVRGPLIHSLCETLHANPAWRDAGEALFKAVETVTIGAIWKRAQVAAADKGGSVRSHLIEILTEVLRKVLGDGGHKRSEKIKTRAFGDRTGRRLTAKTKDLRVVS